MNWISTPDSSAIEGFGYDASKRTLEIKFKHGETYMYFKVPETVFDQLVAAPSKGHFITEHVKGTYEFQDKRDAGRPPRVREKFSRR